MTIDKRLMYQYGGGADMGAPSTNKSSSGKSSKAPAGGASSGGNYGGNINPTQTYGGNVRTVSGGDRYVKDDPMLSEKTDYVGETIFGPTQKYTGKSSFFGGANKYGYTDQYVNPTKPNFGQLKPGYGGRIIGGLISLLTGIPFVGGAIGSAYDKGVGIFRNKYYDDMSEYNKLGLYGINPATLDFDPNAKIQDTSFLSNDPILENYLEFKKSSPDDVSFKEYLQNKKNAPTGIMDTSILPSNNLRTEVTKMDLQKFKQPMTQTMDYDTYMSINPGSTLTPYEFEQLKQGNITQPGTYVG